MKTAALALLPVLLGASCAQVKMDPNTRVMTFTSIGTDYDAVEMAPDRLVIVKQNQSKTAMSLIRTVGTIASTWIVNDMLKSVRETAASEVINGQNTDVAKTGLKEATTQTQIKADAATEALKIHSQTPILP